MPLGASRLTLLARSAVTAVAEVIRKKRTIISPTTYGASVSTTQSQFGGASGYFDATQPEYLYVEGNQESVDFSGDFTLECWIRLENTTSNRKIFDLRGINAAHPGADTTFALANTLLIDANTTSLRVFVDGSDRATLTSGELSATTWHHIAVQRQSGTINAWVDGTRAVNYASSTDYTSVFAANQAIGCNLETASKANGMFGYIDEVRWSTVARYTNGASITVPTAPFTNDSDTYLLLHMNGTDASTYFEDDNGLSTDRSSVAINALQQAQTKDDQYKFGRSSLYLDGADDCLEVGGDTFLDDFVNGSEFTVEYWVRPQSTSGFETHFGNWGGSTTRCFFLGSNNGSTLAFYWVDTGDAIDTTVSGVALTRNAWNHVALVGDASEFRLYANGSLVDSATREDVRSQAERTRIGASATNAEDLLGHIDELRVSTVARYTGSSYTEPTEAFTNDSDTYFLCHFDGVDGNQVFRDDNGSSIDNSVGLNPGGAFELDTNVDHSSISATTDDWTISYWFRMDSGATGDQFVFQWFSGSGGSGNKLLVRFETNGDLEVYIENGFKYLHNFSSEFATTGDNAWHHMVLSNKKSTSSYECYVDGSSVSLTTATPTTIDFTSLEGIGIGTDQGGTLGDSSGIAQVALWYGTAYDLSTNISKFYDGGLVDMGSDGTASGLAQPTIFCAGPNFGIANYGDGNYDHNVEHSSGATRGQVGVA